MYNLTRLFLALLISLPAFAQESNEDLWAGNNFKGLKMRSIGPAFTAGRIADIAIDPQNESTWYVVVASGNLWKTTNNGTTWQTTFDDQSSYSLGCVTIDPQDPNVVWLGTGENVGGRHMGYGDGIYRSTDGGLTWKNMGLKASERISKIIVHPENSDIIWVAAQGPLWNKGGERGLYKSTDGGKTWQKTLGNSEWTGVTDLVIDPRNPDVLYAATWDRHRTIAAYMGGGPGTGLHKSTDGGDTWTKLKQGLPSQRMGKIGLAIEPQDPDIIYAAIELYQREGAVYRSTDRGASWSKRSDAVSGATGPHYYQELYASPHKKGLIYLMDIRIQVSEDGGKTFRRLKEENKHSDNHALAFKMSDPDYLLAGCDGGLYESFDHAENWRFVDNMPITQFYKLAVDDAEPFYNIYGGTQDNATQGGPSRTDNAQGIQNGHWSIIMGGDGHQPATEPGNPNIVYAQSQQGHSYRIDMATGEQVKIQPVPEKDAPFERFNWDAPILVSQHDPARVYVASQRLHVSNDRGDSWTALSGDLTTGANRLEMPIMGKKQSYDNAWDLYAMSTYATITSIAESPLDEKRLYIGTDDGLLQFTTNGGENWRKVAVGDLPGAPDKAYVNNIVADRFDKNTLYVALDNHKFGDFAPYLYRSTDNGKSWEALHKNIPARHIVWRLVQDPQKAEVLFIGTEFGVFFSHDAGTTWTKLSGGVPNIPFRDITIQEREDDLVGATFGRSFYVYDDIKVFREVTEENLKADAHLYSLRPAWWYNPRPKLAASSRFGSMGAGHYVADNPPLGPQFTYHLNKEFSTPREKRQEVEKEQTEKGADIDFPGYDALAREQSDLDQYQLFLVISDTTGKELRRLKAPMSKGFHRLAWNMRTHSTSSVGLGADQVGGSGYLVAPGTYHAQLQVEHQGKLEPLGNKQSFSLKPLHQNTLDNPLADQTQSFRKRYEDLSRQKGALSRQVATAGKLIKALGAAAKESPWFDQTRQKDLHALEEMHFELTERIDGNRAKRKIGEKTKPTLSNRLYAIGGVISGNTYGPTPQAVEQAVIVETLLEDYQQQGQKLLREARAMAQALYEAGGPYLEGSSNP